MPISAQDRQDYPFIIGYAHYLGAYDYWTSEMVRMAREGGAPRTTILARIEPAHSKVVATDLSTFAPETQARLVKHMQSIGLDTSAISHEAA